MDADIAGFFDNIDHDWMMKFLEHRIGDRRVLRLIRKWLTAGVSEEGEWSETVVGTPQGAVISPLLANVYLHYVFDLWIHHWRENYSQGGVRVVRYADDFVIGFRFKEDARRCMELLRKRFGEFGLELHQEKTKLIEFGRFAMENHEKRGDGTPNVFDFLGFTHKCARTRSNGTFTVHRHSSSKRMRAKLSEVKLQLRNRRHRPLKETGRWLASVLQGWFNYHAVPGNIRRLCRFQKEVTKLWLKSIRRRSQRGRRRWSWSRMRRLCRNYFPCATILHPYPRERFTSRYGGSAILKARAV